MEIRPSFIKYIKKQIDTYYKLTGEIQTNNGEIFWEENFSRNIFISNLIITFLWQIVTGYFQFIGLKIFMPIIDNIKVEEVIIMMLMLLLYLASYLFVCLIVTPLLMKLVRLISGLRWLFIKFNNDQVPKPKGRYMAFYNQVFIPYDRMFYTESKKVKGIKKHYNEEHDIQDRRILFNMNIYYIIVSILFTFLFLDKVAPSLNQILTVRIIIYLLYNIFIYIYWKKEFAEYKET